jgi:hypothetical protein
MHITTIKTVNLKSHEEVVCQFPPTGVVRFKGGNNDGKSVIVDVLVDVISCNLHLPRVRHPMISYWASCGDLFVQRNDGAIFQAHIDFEASKTYYSLTLPGEKAVIRYLADKTVRDLVTEFGFHWDEKHQMSLNIYKTFDQLLFVNTSESMNADILNSASTDPVAERARDNLVAEYKVLFERAKECSNFVGNLANKIGMIELEDEDELDRRGIRSKYLSVQIKALSTHEVPDLAPHVDLSTIESLDVSSQRELLKDFKYSEVMNWEVIERLDTESVYRVLYKDFYTVIPRLKDIEMLDTNGLYLTDVSKEFLEYQDKVSLLDRGICYACGTEFEGELHGRDSINCTRSAS